MHKTIAFTLAIALSGTALAQSTTDVKANSPYSAYVQDGRGVIVRSNSGLCWRTNYWTPADAVPGCDGDLAPPIANVIAPPIVQAQSTPDQKIPNPPAPVRCDFSVTLEADQTFAFNSATLTNAAKARMNTQLHGKLANCGHIDSIVVNGYTDRLGSDNYNLTLSEKRAVAVAEYLKSIGVTDPIELRGLGKQRALKICEHITILKKLIDCLAPNRRVEIEVRGIAR